MVLALVPHFSHSMVTLRLVGDSCFNVSSVKRLKRESIPMLSKCNIILALERVINVLSILVHERDARVDICVTEGRSMIPVKAK